MAGVVTYTMTVDGEPFSGQIAYTVKTEQEIQVVTATADQVIAMGGVTTATVVVIHSDQTISCNINSTSGTDIAIVADRPQVFLGGSITSLCVSNASGSTANIHITMYGV